MIIARLTDEEETQLLELAEARQAIKRGGGFRDKRVDRSIGNVAMHLKGIRAEYVVAKALGVPFDTRVLCAGVEGKNLRLTDGRSVEVQSRQDWMIFNPNAFRSDVAVLVNPAYDRRLHICGWVDKATFQTNHFVHDFGYGMRQCMTSDALRPLDELVSLEKAA